MDGKLLLVIVLSISTTCLCQNEIPVVTLGESGCISTYQDLKASLRNNRTANVNRMLDAFYPPNLTPSHVVFVRYCIKNNYTFDLMDPVAEDFDECYEFQWLANTIPLLIDSDVFLANTFNFASLVQLNLTVSIDPFCEDIDSLQLLETLTVWLKSYAQSDEDTIKSYSIRISELEEEDSTADEGYLGIFEINGTDITFVDSRLLASAKKLVIGLWLGTTSITFALILHIGRVSARTARALNSVLRELTEIVDKIIGLPQKAVSFVRGGVTGKEAKEESKGKSADSPKPAVKTNNEANDVELRTVTFDIDVEKNDKIIYEQEGGATEEDAETNNRSSDEQSKTKATDENVDDNLDLEEVVVIKNPEAYLENGKRLSETSQSALMSPSSTSKSTDAFVYKKKRRRVAELKHAFNHFTKLIQKASTLSTIATLAFLGYDIYIYSRFARRLSYDWLILFPFPFWFFLVTLINIVSFFVTEGVLLFKQRNSRLCTKGIVLFKITSDFVIAMSATTAPLFVFFHLFWLFLALSAFSIRLLSSATFYLPLAIFGLWLLSVVSGMFKQWSKLVTIKGKKGESKIKKVLSFVGSFLYSLIPVFFLPFWILLLATLHFFSDFLLEVVNLEEHSFIVVIAVIGVITATTRKISKHCQPRTDDED